MDKAAIRKAVVEFLKIPERINKISGVIAYDLMHGPSFVVAPDGDWSKWTVDHHATFYVDLAEYGKPVSTYTSPLADELRDYIREMPSTLYYDIQCGAATDSEPEGYEDEETGEWYEPDWGDWMKLETRDIVSYAFGQTIAREFDW